MNPPGRPGGDTRSAPPGDPPETAAAGARLVLVGAGHAHAQVLRDWARAPLPGVQLVLVSPQALAPYSGMVPGWLAGQYRYDEICIDVARLCAAAGAQWVRDELQALDADQRRVQLRSGAWLPYTLLSLNVGATLRPPAVHAGCTLLALRPLAQLQPAYEALLAEWAAAPAAGAAPYTVTAVGGGAAGVESLLAVLARLRALRPDRPVHGGLLSRGLQLLPDLSAPARRAALRALARAGVTVQLGTAWCDTVARSSQLLLWATGAQAHDWQLDAQRRGALAVSARGYVRVDAQLRSVSHPQVFAVGDGAEWAEPLPKAGVYAVRMGPVLAHNLRVALTGAGGWRAYRPQRRFLALLATGDGRAIASRGPFGAHGRWAWHWKDHIDRSFIARFAAPPVAAAAAPGGG